MGVSRRQEQKKPSYLSSGNPAVLLFCSGPVAFRPPIPLGSAFSDQGDNPPIVTMLWHAADLVSRFPLLKEKLFYVIRGSIPMFLYPES